MERRDVIRASGATLAVALAGCTGESKPGNPTTTDETTTLGPAETTYDLGTAHSHDQWSIAVTGFELTTAFRIDGGGTYEMPDGKQLGIATVEVENRASEEEVWAGMPFAVIFRGRVHEDKRGFKHPEFSGYVSLDDLERIEHSYQYSPEAYPVNFGKTVTLWALFLLSSDASRDELTVGFDSATDDGATYPVRWTVN